MLSWSRDGEMVRMYASPAGALTIGLIVTKNMENDMMSRESLAF